MPYLPGEPRVWVVLPTETWGPSLLSPLVVRVALAGTAAKRRPS